MLRLRPYRATDAEKILSFANNEEIFYKWTAGVLGDFPLSFEQFNQVMNNMAFTAIDEEQVVGFFILRNPGDDLNEVRVGFVIVDPEIRGKGYGKRMLQLGLKYAKEIYGATKASLGVFANNDAAYQCYKAVGFKELENQERETYKVLDEEWSCVELDMKL